MSKQKKPPQQFVPTVLAPPPPKRIADTVRVPHDEHGVPVDGATTLVVRTDPPEKPRPGYDRETTMPENPPPPIPRERRSVVPPPAPPSWYPLGALYRRPTSFWATRAGWAVLTAGFFVVAAVAVGLGFLLAVHFAR